jgi:CheY-like chemotaxis protein
MPPDVLDRIFEPFFTTKDIGKGTGMGLAVVIGVVENHGGFVNVQSKIGEGAEFKIYFPALPSLAEIKSAPSASAAPRGNGELILIVDDEPAVLKVTSKILEKNGYQTLTANGGAEALAIYGQNVATIKAIVSDLSMPGMDGLGLASALMNSHPQAKIIIATGLGDTLDPAKLNKFGIKQVLKKPFTSEAILTALRQIL